MQALPAFDEMFGTGEGYNSQSPDGVTAAYRAIRQWLADSPAELMAARRAQAELFFRRIGITFAVYGDAQATERLIPFDIVPRIITRPEWQRLEKGL